MRLTDTSIRKAKPTEAPIKMVDGEGMYLLVKPNGSKLWQMSYRFAGKQKTLSFGRYPDVSLLDAREQRRDAKGLLRNGTDPGEQKRAARESESETDDQKVKVFTFKMIAKEVLDRKEEAGNAEATLEKNGWLIGLATAEFGDRAIGEINSADCLKLLQHIEQSGRRETARRLRATMSEVFRRAIVTLRAERDPTEALKGAILPPVVSHRPAIVDPKAFGRLLVLLDEFDGWPTLKACLQIQALCFARPVETRTMRWAEVDFDKAIWTVPAEKMKMRRAHEVPLSRQAVEVLQQIQEFSGRYDLVFPQIRQATRPLSENAMNSALRRLGIAQHEHCAHGFRTSASTMLNEARFHHDVIEVQLSHVDEDEVRRAYNRARYWPERVAMMQAWADKCDDLKRAAMLTVQQDTLSVRAKTNLEE